MNAAQPDSTRSQQSAQIDNGAFMLGTVIGLVIGALAALWYAPLSGRRLWRILTAAVDRTAQSARTQADVLNRSLMIDPVAQSLAEGKAAARRRRAALGLLEHESR